MLHRRAFRADQICREHNTKSKAPRVLGGLRGVSVYLTGLDEDSDTGQDEKRRDAANPTGMLDKFHKLTTHLCPPVV